MSVRWLRVTPRTLTARPASASLITWSVIVPRLRKARPLVGIAGPVPQKSRLLWEKERICRYKRNASQLQLLRWTLGERDAPSSKSISMLPCRRGTSLRKSMVERLSIFCPSLAARLITIMLWQRLTAKSSSRGKTSKIIWSMGRFQKNLSPQIRKNCKNLSKISTDQAVTFLEVIRLIKVQKKATKQQKSQKSLLTL